MQGSASVLSQPTSKVRFNVLEAARRHPLVIAYLVAVVPAAVMAITQPVWSLVDEAQHFDFIVQLGHGVYPLADSTLISPDTLNVTERTGIYRAFYLPGTYPTPDLSDMGLPPAGMSDQANATWMQRHMWQLSRESIQTPGYYAVMVPVWWAANAVGGALAAVYALRIVNALIAAALAPMAIVVARMLMPARPEVGALAAAFAILLPGLELNLPRISNDTLGAVIGGAAVLLAVRWVGTVWPWRRVVITGLLLGAGLLIKLTLAGLFPALAVSLLWPAAGATWRARVARTAVMGTIAAVCLVPWFALNLHGYGGITPGARGARVSDAVPHPLTPEFVPLDIGVFVLTYWSGEPWGWLPFSGAFAVLGALIALMAPAGVVKALRARSAGLPAGRLAVAAVSVLVMIAVTLALPATFGFEFLGPGRYAYPALPAAAAFCAIGLSTVVGTFARRSITTLYAMVAVAMIVAGAVGLPPARQPGSGVPPPGARVVSVESNGQSQGLTISVDRVALDSTAHATWFHVTAANSGPDEIEWTVPPVASTVNAEATGDYLRSTHLPGDLDPGESVSGWLFVPLDPSQVHATEPIALRFSGVAIDGYHELGTVEISVLLAP